MEQIVPKEQANFAFRVRASYTRPQSRNGDHPPRAFIILTRIPACTETRPLCEWNPKIISTSRGEIDEAGFRNTDDRERKVLQVNCLANRAGIAAKFALPVAIIQHDHRSGRWRIVGRLKDSTGSRADAKGLEIVAGNIL